ncbi:MAG: tetratricopeptide repeat protein [Candidatus Marinimicrobia bacterium]|nr:tetratricopeptide repeat protein [Candidatus Neomarinimicrobiota bacterium]
MRKILHILLVIILIGINIFAQDLEEAQSYFDDGFYEEALDICQQIVEENPNNAEANFLLGRIYFKLGELSQANSYVNKAINQDRGNEKYREVSNKMRSFANLRSEAQRLESKGNYAEAVQNYKKMIEQNSNYAAAYFDLARVLGFRMDKPVEAAKYLKQAIEIKPEEKKFQDMYQGLSQNLLQKGMNNLKRNNFTEAYNNFIKVTEIDSTNAYGYYFAGLAEYYNNNYDNTLNLVNKAIEINPEYIKSYMLKGKTYRAMNQQQQAINAYLAATEVDNEYASAWDDIGSVYNNMGENQKAADAYHKLIKLEPKNGLAYTNLGAIYNQMEEYETAIKYLKKAVELRPEEPIPWFRLAVAYNETNNNQGAVKAASKCLQYKSNWAPALLELGKAELKLGRNSKAKVHFSQAAKDPKYQSQAQFYLDKLNG